MERFPTPESAPPSKEQVIESLKNLGAENPEARERLNAWLDAEQGRVEKGKCTNLEFNIAWAEVYRDAELTNEAREAFDQCAEIAYQEGNEELLAYCEEQIRNLPRLEE